MAQHEYVWIWTFPLHSSSIQAASYSGSWVTETIPEHESLHWPNETLTLDHAPNEINRA